MVKYDAYNTVKQNITIWSYIILIKLKSSLQFKSFTVATMTWLTVAKYPCHKWPRYVPFVVIIPRSLPHSWLFNGFVTRVMRRVSLVEQELHTFQEHLNSLPVFSGVRVIRSLVLCVIFCRSLFVLFSFRHCIVCPSSIYGFWLPVWYLQAILWSEDSETS